MNTIFYLIFFAACKIGYIGTNCDTMCVYPSYGSDCQSSCNCIANQCDHANGCRHHTKGTRYKFVYMKSFDMLKTIIGEYDFSKTFKEKYTYNVLTFIDFFFLTKEV